MNVLSLNPGSSSLKFALIGEQELCRGSTDGEVKNDVVQAAVRQALESGTIDAVACRVVHGGNRFHAPTRIDDAALAAIEALAPLAPLHNEVDVHTIRAAQSELPNVPVYAVFDTAFHQTLPPEAFAYALPLDVARRHGLRRYGFHGIAYRHVTSQLPGCSRLVACHLGNGASACAIHDGRSVDTSMGMTPLEGLIMGTRSGDVDPGLVLFLERHLGMTVDAVDDLLNDKSGLLGLSGISADVRELSASLNDHARLALDAFSYRVAKYIGGYAVALGGIDGIAFSGGIGEHSDDVRRRICQRLAFLGVHLAPDDHASGLRRISVEGSLPVWVVPADEELQMAREVQAISES